ncbi:MAG: hypothetical protein LBL31_07415 [Spirochaetaceae bacterium]|jgi:hypothetical protein|nr:hypothetical protein [Spirochaetaceae bacterium]
MKKKRKLKVEEKLRMKKDGKNENLCNFFDFFDFAVRLPRNGQSVICGSLKKVLAACALCAKEFMMKTKRFLFSLAVPVSLAMGLVVAASLTLAGCGGGGDGGDDGNLPRITELTTGRETVTGKDITVSGNMLPSLDTRTGFNGETYSITGGKFSFTLPESPALSPASELRYTLFGDDSGDYTATPDNATFAMVSSFYWKEGNTSYSIRREVTKTDGATYRDRSEIVYVYASKDVTLSQDVKNRTVSNEKDNGTSSTQWGAVNLALKKGWNLVQIDSYATVNGNNATQKTTVKIATHNVPWTIDTYEESD